MTRQRTYRRHSPGTVMLARVAFVSMPSLSCAAIAKVIGVPLSTAHAWTYRSGLRRIGLEESMDQIEGLWRGTDGADTSAMTFARALLLGVQNALEIADCQQPVEFAVTVPVPAVNRIPDDDDSTVRDWLVRHVATLVPALDAANRRVAAALSMKEEARHVAV